jgi:hypothetical protein
MLQEFQRHLELGTRNSRVVLCIRTVGNIPSFGAVPLSAQECVVVSFVRCGIIAASLMTGKFILRAVEASW